MEHHYSTSLEAAPHSPQGQRSGVIIFFQINTSQEEEPGKVCRRASPPGSDPGDLVTIQVKFIRTDSHSPLSPGDLIYTRRNFWIVLSKSRIDFKCKTKSSSASHGMFTVKLLHYCRGSQSVVRLRKTTGVGKATVLRLQQIYPILKETWSLLIDLNVHPSNSSSYRKLVVYKRAYVQITLLWIYCLADQIPKEPGNMLSGEGSTT